MATSATTPATLPPATSATPAMTPTPLVASSPPAVAAASADKDVTPTKGKVSGKRKATEPPAPRAPNWVAGELHAVLSVAPAHWASYRGSRTGDKSRRTGEELTAAFGTATPVENCAVALKRTEASLERKLEDTRTIYVATRKNLCRTGLRASQREDFLINCGGSELYSLARAAFKSPAVANESTYREPVVFGAPEAPACGLETAPADAGGEGSVAPGRTSTDKIPTGTACTVDGGPTLGQEGLAQSSPRTLMTRPIRAGAPAGPDVEGTGADSEGSSGDADANDTVHEAVELLAGAEALRNCSKAKKVSTSGAIAAFLDAKNEREKVLFAERHGGGPSDSREATNGVSDNDIRIAVLDMIGAIAAKARRQ
ncbi:hypothetical protein BU14_0326s0001 [Porphyra umbilicalis]|uniref:Uncharacterized protein n=1 Tax=Porphyra umbilicalis TaxID=2786 RepID=A0A1X6NYZ7_PORUM|nr:hypothetical protein BU14_0326s0001 [Porphyra umbilicalis]|eukprot:OSX73807.1 hypothetical protein BU14_0326s0001 [Porphyra umbilicalis]